MLKLVPNPTFTAPVQITVPGGALETLRVTFRHKSADGLAAWFTANVEKSAKEALLEVIESWSGVVDEKGEEVPFSDEALDRLLHGYKPAANELITAYVKALTESRAKN